MAHWGWPAWATAAMIVAGWAYIASKLAGCAANDDARQEVAHDESSYIATDLRFEEVTGERTDWCAPMDITQVAPGEFTCGAARCEFAGEERLKKCVPCELTDPEEAAHACKDGWQLKMYGCTRYWPEAPVHEYPRGLYVTEYQYGRGYDETMRTLAHERLHNLLHCVYGDSDSGHESELWGVVAPL